MGDKNDYILFYSNKCLHSKELLNILYKDPDLNQKFVKINIDNGNVKIPPYVKSVPTAIINTNGKPNLLVGSAIFSWYKQKHAVTVEKQGIQDWDPHTMTGYSDGFSYLDNPQVIKKAFAFLNDNNAIITPDEGSYGGSESSSNGSSPQYNSSVPKQNNGQQNGQQFNNNFPEFTGQVPGQSRDDLKNQKKSAMDNDYEKFMNQRNYDVPSPAPRMG